MQSSDYFKPVSDWLWPKYLAPWRHSLFKFKEKARNAVETGCKAKDLFFFDL